MTTAPTRQGTPCGRFGHTLRYVNGGKCVECSKLRNKENRASITASRRARYHADEEYRTRTLANTRARRERNIDKIRAQQRAWYATDPARHAARTRALRHGFRDEDHLAEWLGEQGNRCKSCLETSLDMHVDHDHSCCGPKRACGPDGCVRGLLCGRCNVTLGRYREDPVALLALANYALEVS